MSAPINPNWPPSEDEVAAYPEPCGYCRRCAIHDDPGGCTTVQEWEREHPEVTIVVIQRCEWMSPAAKDEAIRELENIIDERLGIAAVAAGVIGQDPFDRAEAMGDWDADDDGFAPAGAML